MEDNKCEQVLVLDLRGISPMADYFVIASGGSERQLHSVIEELRELARQEGQSPAATDGHGSAGWIVADFFDVVIHLFSYEMREYYDLEGLWADAPRLDWRSATTPGQFARIGVQRHEDKPAGEVDLTASGA